MAPTIGFIGLGMMGRGMARNLLDKGFPLTTMAHRRRDALVEIGVEAVDELDLDLAGLYSARLYSAGLCGERRREEDEEGGQGQEAQEAAALWFPRSAWEPSLGRSASLWAAARLGTSSAFGGRRGASKNA